MVGGDPLYSLGDLEDRAYTVSKLPQTAIPEPPVLALFAAGFGVFLGESQIARCGGQELALVDLRFLPHLRTHGFPSIRLIPPVKTCYVGGSFIGKGDNIAMGRNAPAPFAERQKYLRDYLSSTVAGRSEGCIGYSWVFARRAMIIERTATASSSPERIIMPVVA